MRARPTTEDRAASRGALLRFLQSWAPHLVYPGDFTSLTPRAASAAVAGRPGVAGSAADAEPLTQGYVVRSDLELYAVGRGVGAALDDAEQKVRTGYFALAVALREIAATLERGGDEPDRSFEQAGRAVADTMREAAKADPIFEHAGCAATALWLVPGQALILHAGDCEAVRLRAGMAQPLTVEHTLERDCRDKGIPLPSPYVRSVLLRLLGAFDPPRGQPDILTADIVPDDRVLLLSSDVATRLVPSDYVGATEGSPAEAARRLLDVALSRKAPEGAVVVADVT